MDLKELSQILDSRGETKDKKYEILQEYQDYVLKWLKEDTGVDWKNLKFSIERGQRTTVTMVGIKIASFEITLNKGVLEARFETIRSEDDLNMMVAAVYGYLQGAAVRVAQDYGTELKEN